MGHRRLRPPRRPPAARLLPDRRRHPPQGARPRRRGVPRHARGPGRAPRPAGPRRLRRRLPRPRRAGAPRSARSPPSSCPTTRPTRSPPACWSTPSPPADRSSPPPSPTPSSCWQRGGPRGAPPGPGGAGRGHPPVPHRAAAWPSAWRPRPRRIGPDLAWPAVAGRYADLRRRRHRRPARRCRHDGDDHRAAELRPPPGHDRALRHASSTPTTAGARPGARLLHRRRRPGPASRPAGNRTPARRPCAAWPAAPCGSSPTPRASTAGSATGAPPPGGGAGRHTAEDCWGRSLWGLGAAAATDRGSLGADALAYFEHGTDPALALVRRAMAFAALGAAERARRLTRATPGPAALPRGRRRRHHRCATPTPRGRWPEPRLTYANAVLPEAMIAAGVALERQEPASTQGLELLAVAPRPRDGRRPPVGDTGRRRRASMTSAPASTSSPSRSPPWPTPRDAPGR